MRPGRRVVVRVGLAFETGRLAFGGGHVDRIVQGLRAPVVDVGDASAAATVTVTERRQRAGDLFADNAEHHHVRAWYEHGDHDHGRGCRQADHHAHVGPPSGKHRVRGRPAQPDGGHQVSGDGEARALPVVALRPEHERRRDAQEHQQQRVVGHRAQEQWTVDEHPTQVGRRRDGGVYGRELDHERQLHAHGEREQGRLQVTVHVAHEARVAVARGDHHAPGQHGGEHESAAARRAEQLGVAHGVPRPTGGAIAHRERHGAGVHEQRAGDQHERERRVALHHVLLADPHQYERRYARGARGAHRRHGQRGRYPHVLLPRHQQRSVRRGRGRWCRGRPHPARWTRPVRLAALAQIRQLTAAAVPLQPQPARAVRVLRVTADRLAAAAVLGHVHQRHVVLATAAVQQQQPVQHPAHRLYVVITRGRTVCRHLAALCRGRVPAALVVAVVDDVPEVRVHRAQHVHGRLHELRGHRLQLFCRGRGSNAAVAAVATVVAVTAVVVAVDERATAIRLKHVRPVLKV